MTPTPSRRWHRFSLRTLFVVVTVLCVFGGYELNWIRQRHEAFARKEVIAIPLEPALDFLRPPAPALLWLFGEPGYFALQPVRAVGDDELAVMWRMQQLFPEAIVHFPPQTSQWTYTLGNSADY